MDKIIKKRGPRTSDQLPFRKIPLLVINDLTKFDDVI